MERRYTATEVRSEDKKIKGQAAPYYDGSSKTEYRLWDNVYERIAKGAFDESIGGDIVALYNHNENMVLGRTPDTLRVWTNDDGLQYEIDPPDTTIGRDVMTSINRRDVRGSSFAFTVDKEEWKQDGDKDVREVQKVTLYDVSPVTRPAYGSGTNVGVRSAELRELKDSHTEWRRELETRKRIAHVNQLIR